MWTTCEQLWKEKWIHVNKARYYRAVFYVDKWMKLFNYSHKMVRDTGLWGFWSHHHLLLLPGHSSLFSRFGVSSLGGSVHWLWMKALREWGIRNEELGMVVRRIKSRSAAEYKWDNVWKWVGSGFPVWEFQTSSAWPRMTKISRLRSKWRYGGVLSLLVSSCSRSLIPNP